MPATYNRPWLSIRDRLRFLFQDNVLIEGTSNLEAATVPDEDYDDAIEYYGVREGAAQVALSYAAYYAQQVQRFGQSGDVDVAYFRERITHYQALAADIRTGRVPVEAGYGTSIAGAFAGNTPLPTRETDERMTFL